MNEWTMNVSIRRSRKVKEHVVLFRLGSAYQLYKMVRVLQAGQRHCSIRKQNQP
jgi:hypothetical protein